MKFVKTLLAVILGYAVMIILITIVQEGWLGRITWAGSSFSILIVAGVFTFLAAVAAGMAATVIAGKGSKLPAILISGIVTIETALVIITGRGDGPILFDFYGAANHIVGLLTGWAIVAWLTGSLRRPI